MLSSDQLENKELMGMLDQVYRFVLDQQNLKVDMYGIPYAFVARNFGKRALRILPPDVRLVSVLESDNDRFLVQITGRGGYKVSAVPPDKIEQLRSLREMMAMPLEDVPDQPGQIE